MNKQILTKRGYDFYEVASALQKSIRRGDTELAGYMAMELFPNYANYCWKRLLTISAEDCYGIITKEIYSLYQSFQMVNYNKKGKELGGRVFISKAVILLSQCRHNRDADLIGNYIYDKKYGITDEQINEYFDEIRKENKEIPNYVYDVHTRKGKIQGKTKQEFFIEEDEALSNKQLSIFDIDLKG